MPTAVSLAPAGDVKQAGVTIGRVSKIAERGNGTVLELELDDKHSPVYRDAQVLLRSKSIAGENYVEVSPGTPKAGEVPSGELLAPSAAKEATQIDELFSVFDEARRRDLQRALAGLGDGLRGDGEDLNRTLEAASALATEANPAFKTMADENRHVARLVDSFGRVAAAIGERREGVRQLTLQAKAAAEAVDDRDDKLRDFIAELPGFLRQARSTSNRLTTFSGGATPVVRDLRQATEALVPTVRDLLPAAREGQGLVTELARFSRAAVPALDKLAPFSSKARTFVPPLAAFLRQGNPMFAYMAPYFREVGTFFANDAASFQHVDALGHVARIVLPISRSNAGRRLHPRAGPGRSSACPGRAGHPRQQRVPRPRRSRRLRVLHRDSTPGSRPTRRTSDDPERRSTVSTSKPVVVYGASGYTGRLVCEYLREYNVPLHRRRPQRRARRGRDEADPRHRDRAVRGRRGGQLRRGPHRAPLRRQGRLQHGRPVRQVRRRRRRGVHRHRHPLPRHHRRAGLDDGLRRELRRAHGRAGRAAVAGRRADVHHRRDRREHRAGDPRASTRST